LEWRLEHIMTRSLNVGLLWIVSVSIGTGCTADAYLRTCQVVDLAVTSRTAVRPVEAATVSYVQRTDQPEVSSLSDDALLSEYGRVGGVTDPGGRVSIEMNTSRIVGGLSLWLGGYNPKSDQVTGKSFVFEVSTDHFSDVVVTKMKEDVEIAGSHVIVRVERIGPARERSKESIALTEGREQSKEELKRSRQTKGMANKGDEYNY
jgi:hypothetical protein